MSRGRTRNRYTILSSDIDNDDTEDGALPPSDLSDQSESESESGQHAPIQRMPALTSLLEAADNMDPLPNRAHPQLHQMFFQPIAGPLCRPKTRLTMSIFAPEHPTSDDILWTPRTEKKFLRRRVEAQRQQSRITNRTERVCSYAICKGRLTDPSSGHYRRVTEAGG
ncbi:hypothetical protein B0H14DRAFT_2573908 [Mycena olivaceomarginata]|nr:hypothetical protein B0H14DRAFT_2573908 [Mycena olivaceomarginata]